MVFSIVGNTLGSKKFKRFLHQYLDERKGEADLSRLQVYVLKVVILQEHAVNRILQDLVQLLDPLSMVIEADYKQRGGLTTKVIARYQKEPR